MSEPATATVAPNEIALDQNLDDVPGLIEISADGGPEDRAAILFAVEQLLRNFGFDVQRFDTGMRRERLELVLTPERRAWIAMLRAGLGGVR